jgi:hypothetical protein
MTDPTPVDLDTIEVAAQAIIRHEIADVVLATDGPLRIGYADPPYPGQSAKHYSDHADYAGEVDHGELLQRLDADYDGWVLHTSSPALEQVLHLAREHGVGPYRVMAWVKPFAAFKRNVSVAYAWEPVLVKAVRKPLVGGGIVMRDYVAESITMRRGLSGAKPERVCWWLFEVLGAQPGDVLDDIFPGSGAVAAAWRSWAAQRPLAFGDAS